MVSTVYKWKRYLRVVVRSKNTRIFLGAIFLGLFVILSFVYESYVSYENEIKKAEIQTSNLAQVLEGQIATSFKNIDLVLQSLQDRIDAGKINSKNYRTYNDILKIHSSRMPEVLSIKVTDENGEFLSDDRGTLSKNLNIRDREYYKKFKQRPVNRLIISNPVISRTAGVWVVVLSRPILSPEGKFKGIILATIQIDHYKKMFDAINVGKTGMIGLYGLDRVLFARRPYADKVGKVVNVAPEIVKLTVTDSYSTTYKNNSRVDRINRVFSARKMQNYPFVVVTGLSSHEFLAEWKFRTTVHSIIIFLFLALSTFFLRNFLLSLKQVEEQRKQAMQSAKLSSLGEMASGIAHEINNPLSIISMTAKKLKKHRLEVLTDPKLMTDLEKIITTSDRIAKIVRGLRSFSRDSFDDPYLPVPVSKIIENTLDLCHEKIKGRNVSLHVNSISDLLITCREIQIAQVLMNLLNNSLDAIEFDEERWIKIDVISTGKRTQILVSDSGKLIPHHIAEKMMLPFFTTKEIGKGTGLGLSISRGIIENHQGRFYLDRTKPHNTFVIDLPQAHAATQAA